MLALKSLRTPATEGATPALAGGTASPSLAAAQTSAPGGEFPRAAPERAIPASTQMRDRVAATVEEQPEVAARLLRSWMKE
jgi:flagellar biosynthesis/type III secretory pathway M-ring protein FliF/YscJ